MKGLGYIFKPARKRPVLLIILGVITFLYCYLEYSVIMPVFSWLSILKTGNILDSIMHLIQMFLRNIPNISLMNIGFVLLAIVATSLIVGLVMSGFLNILNSVLVDKEKEEKEFLKGIKKHYLKVSRTTFLTILYSVLFVIFIVVVSIPSIVITNAFIAGKNELMSVAYLLDFITVGILFFGMMFFKIYTLFWYPAAINYDNKLFARGKRTADNLFWRIVLRFIGIDLLLIVFQIGLFYLNNVLSAHDSIVSDIIGILVLLLVNWVFKTATVLYVISFVFSRFIEYWKLNKKQANTD